MDYKEDILFVKVSDDEVVQAHTVRYTTEEPYTRFSCQACDLTALCRDYESAKFIGSMHMLLEAKKIKSPFEVIFDWEDYKPNG